MKIKNIEKKGKYVNVILMDGRLIKFSYEVLYKYGITVGKEFTQEQFKCILEDNNYRLGMEYATNLLSKNFYTSNQIREKLSKKLFPNQIIEKIIEKCKELSLIDDDKYLKTYIEELKRKGYGKNRILSNIYRKGLSFEKGKDFVESLISEEIELENASYILNKKLKSLKTRNLDKSKLKEKLIRHLYTKGFSYNIINKTIEDYLE